MIKFNKYNVTMTDPRGNKIKARVWYSFNETITGGRYLTVYAKDYSDSFDQIFRHTDGYRNETDITTDYFERGKVRMHPEHPMFTAALEAWSKHGENARIALG